MSREDRVEVAIIVSCINHRDRERLVKTIADSLAPDNVEIPEGMSIGMRVEGGKLVVVVSHDIEKIDTLLSTIDEILEHVQLVERSLSTVK